MIDILETLAETLVRDMSEHISNEKYDLDKVRSITHDDLVEFDKRMNDLVKAEPFSVSIFHPRRIRADEDERIFCRLSTVGYDENSCRSMYHISIYVEDKVIVV